ncbi:hypothetical protein [Candidatus Methylacidithermus pantelleriae]|uniref:Uncharacterized protein n=1 Tax=Candidatus Methylacidithermus pantelleriae TaxID=2744239 RepID=A0A8J2BNK5_9BACT|nr:hypothetical protein [Candidatus Methylacidithermus pantelleriae]CAF0698903.1 hypothetical protein MPNT_30056 [Candidatus Methylacidithermus pantelleriae]
MAHPCIDLSCNWSRRLEDVTHFSGLTLYESTVLFEPPLFDINHREESLLQRGWGRELVCL